MFLLLVFLSVLFVADILGNPRAHTCTCMSLRYNERFSIAWRRTFMHCG